ncbi:hypothetical protein WMF20_24465 [Sorangium sp. So ce834]|uniref:hypothetical protein n=1 Tax=Sorangium sp. So ce834 TaxID=3133321 RepID=UPI003F63C64E
MKEMRLSGRDLRVLPGALTVMMHVPVPLAEKRRLGAEEERTIENLLDRFTEATRHVYHRLSEEAQLSRAEIVKMRLEASLQWTLSSEEAKLLEEALDLCIGEGEAGRGVNICFNGDEYGITVQDMRSLRDRVRS